MKVQLIWPFVSAADLTRVHCISGWLTGRDMELREGNKHLRRPRRRIGNCNSRSFKGSYLPHLQGQAVQYVMTITQWHGVTIQSILIFNSTPVMTADVRNSPSVIPRVLTPGTGQRCKFPTSYDCSDQSYIKYSVPSCISYITVECYFFLNSLYFPVDCTLSSFCSRSALWLTAKWSVRSKFRMIYCFHFRGMTKLNSESDSLLARGKENGSR